LLFLNWEKMKRLFLFSAVFILSFSVFSQQITHETIVINVEVPVRVFKGSTFIDNLTLNDFDITEDGVPQKNEAVYLVKKRSIERREEKKRFAPQTSRDFYLFFEITEYTPKLGEGIGYFIRNVIVPGDNLTIITPMKTYKLKSQTFEILSKEEIVSQLKGILRKDALIGSSEYRDIIDDIVRLAKSLSSAVQLGSGSADFSVDQETLSPLRNLDNFSAQEYESRPISEQITAYGMLLEKLESVRSVDQQKFFEFAKLLKEEEGQKHVFMFYEKEYIPHVDPKILNQYMSMYQDRPEVLHTITSLFDFYKRDITLDISRVKQTYADSSISIHFLYISKPLQHIYGIRMHEHSGDIYAAFREMAQATGGFADSSTNSAFLFQKAIEASENYYLLYYSPNDYRRDGKFKVIKVRVKNKSCRVIHRTGYFAN